MFLRALVLFTCGSLAAARPARGQASDQERGANKLHLLVRGLTVTPRVLLIGANPDDEDSNLIAWLSRGRSIETGYLSLTRGEAGANLLGDDLGTTLGAVRVQELLAARRVDGAKQFFTRALDFGFSRNADVAFEHWDHEELLGDVVAVIRAFRPHVIVITTSLSGARDKGQREVLGILAREAYAAAADSTRFTSASFGAAWSPLKMYEGGRGILIDATEYDAVLGRTFADVAVESRSQSRVPGLSMALLGRGRLQLARVASRVNESTPAAAEHSLFDGIDTSFARLARGAPRSAAADLPLIQAYADSARAALDLAQPWSIVQHLARAAQLATRLRDQSPSCNHPSADAGRRSIFAADCDQRMLDLDASVDLVSRRIAEALLAAAGVVIEVTADRELVAPRDHAGVMITIRNYGRDPVTLEDVAVSGAPRTPMAPLVVQPQSAEREFNDPERVLRIVSGVNLPDARPWWIGRRKVDLFAATESPSDGVDRADGLQPVVPRLASSAVPEGTRRTTDVSVTMTVAGATFTLSLGPALYRHEDPRLGVQDRPLSGVPAVSLAFDRGLEWVRARKPIDRNLQLTARSYADSARAFDLEIVAPRGVRVDPPQPRVKLGPHEQRELFLRLRGMLDTGRYQFGAIGVTSSGDNFAEGFRTAQYPHLPPIRIFHASGLWLQAVQVEIPPGLAVAYIAGAGQDAGIVPALRAIGVRVVTATPDELPLLDLSRFTTVVVGTRAYDAHPTLVAQNGRLLEFARAGGALVVLSQERVIPRVLPYPVTLASPFPERVASADAEVTMLDSRARVLRWPNLIRKEDWKGWVAERASFVPTTADPRYATIVEMHDDGEAANPNALLVAPLGRGIYVYSTLAFFRQIPGGVPGSLRLFVNLLSAGQK